MRKTLLCLSVASLLGGCGALLETPYERPAIALPDSWDAQRGPAAAWGVGGRGDDLYSLNGPDWMRRQGSELRSDQCDSRHRPTSKRRGCGAFVAKGQPTEDGIVVMQEYARDEKKECSTPEPSPYEHVLSVCRRRGGA